jgi:manganese oxidase
LQGGGGAPAQATDASWSYASLAGRPGGFSAQPVGGGKIDANCNNGPCFTYPKQSISAGMQAGDPYTPLLAAYPGDPVQLRLLAGGFTTMHDVTMHGMPWKFEPYNPNSGWRESQLQLLSEHFELMVKVPRAGDYLYSTSASLEGNSSGLWGLLRAYPTQQQGLVPLAPNPTPTDLPFTPPALSSDCDRGQPCLRKLAVTALTIQELLGTDQTLIYNGRGLTLNRGPDSNEKLTDPNAIIYVRDDDLCTQGSDACVPGGRLARGRMVEPMVLRVAAGDVVELTLTNAMTGKEPVFSVPISGQRIPYTAPFKSVTLEPSTSVGLHPQLLATDVKTSDGNNVGANPDSTVAPLHNHTFTWYAGTIAAAPNGSPVATPVEFGAVNLLPADPLNHAYRGLFGGLVVEPEGSRWVEDPGDASQATVFTADGRVFRDFVVNGQDDADILLNGQSNYQAGNALSAVNYRTEPAIYR